MKNKNLRKSPYQKNDILTLEITDIGSGGEGIGKKDGYAIFVKDALIGDTVKVKIMKASKNYAFAKLLEVVTPSAQRIDPPCPVARQCGGCQIQAMSYEKQLEFKQNKVRADLLRIGGFSEELIDEIMHPIVGMEHPYRYRNKAQVPIGERDGEPVCGFFAGRTHSIIPIEDCLLGEEYIREILNIIKEYMKEFHVKAYNEETGKGLLRHVLIRGGRYSGQIMVCMIANADKLPEERTLAERLMKISGMHSVLLNTNREKTNVILGKQTRTLSGNEVIEDSLSILEIREENGIQTFVPTQSQVTFRISSRSFYQVNPQQTEKLYSIALSYAQLTGKEVVWDLYCGVGTISLFLARSAGTVYGVEIVPEAIIDAEQNARINGIENAFFYTGKAEEVLPDYKNRMREQGKSDDVDVIVVDPPRKGCDIKCLETILEIQPERVVYVSCDPATLARDLRILADGGYSLAAVQPVDQFAHTVHVETVCLLSKLNTKQHIEVELNMDELDLTSAESKATYEEIKEYVLEHTGLKVSHLYIAQVKRKHGIIERANYNLSKSEDAKQPVCPPEKEKAITKALNFFGMI